MKNKNIFNKKSKNKFFKFYLLIFIAFIILFYIFFLSNNNDYFIISQNDSPYYVIPKDKGGEDILNQDKKGLHLSYKNEVQNKVINDIELKFSIQLFTNIDYEIIKKTRNDLIFANDSIFLQEDLFIAIFKNSIGNEYFLLYKNFDSHLLAKSHCKKYTYFVKKCLIVNVQNLE